MNAARRRRRQLRNAYPAPAWKAPEPFGPDGWKLLRLDRRQSVIISACEFEGTEYLHASIAGDKLPTYADLMHLHNAVWGTTGYAYQAFVPADEHISIHPNALHLWGRADGRRMLPDFGAMGTI